ncbi:restriction endonuclease subunit S [Chryseobacterium sp. ES2]|uniref:Restriction endonuclease subunit S n=1 Tax=Chryseobacterium metallicongregator TaxID=3073042 RepID=A0ABU1E0Q6_9FLAO|nr:restriction endonuclease subunit S [Chryseobacterium sp. ES2]MDR4951383.1 restriction endonuclease subunit S [Chryseobacterium sp. ES2]
MTKKNKSVKNFPNLLPKLRFPEFEENWKVTKLGDICKMQAGKFVSASEVLKETNNKLYPCYGANGLRGFTYSYNYEGEYSLIGRQGALCGNITRVYDKFYATEHAVVVTPKEEVHSTWLFYLLNYLNLNQYATGMAQPGLSVQNLLEVESIITDSIEEQEKIASLLLLIDSRIQTQRKIIEKLETLMKVSRTNIFSQKLRFKNEQGYDFPNWEKLKLGEIGNFQTSSIDKLSRENENEVYLVNYMNVYRHEDINSSTIKSFQKVTAKEQQISSCNLKKGDILFTPSSETPDDIGHSVVISENLENAVFSYHLMRFRPEIEIDILYSHYFCNVPIVLSQLSKFATGSTRFTISVKSFSDVEVSLPSLPEQKVIGKFLSLIENKIEIEKQILEKLELQKKFVLSNLFI